MSDGYISRQRIDTSLLCLEERNIIYTWLLYVPVTGHIMSLQSRTQDFFARGANDLRAPIYLNMRQLFYFALYV